MPGVGSNNVHDRNGNLRSIGNTTLAPDRFMYDNADQMFRSGPCRGDINGDAAVNIADSGLLSSHRGSGSTEGNADGNYDMLMDLDWNTTLNIADSGILGSEISAGSARCRNSGANTGTIRNWFNGAGLRMRARTFYGSSPTRVDNDFVWDQGAAMPQILEDTRKPVGGSDTVTTYLYGLDLIAQTDNASVTTYYFTDGLGSTTEVRGATGGPLNTYRYDVWGGIKTQTGATANSFEFTGEQADHNANRGLAYLRARFYDPALGRFLGRDPVPGGNRYAYVANNPANFIDPSGECRIEVRSTVLFSLPVAVGAFGIHVYTYNIDVHHLYLVSHDPSGSSRAYRVGSTNAHKFGGSFEVRRGPYQRGFADWDPDNEDSSTEVLNDKESCSSWNATFDRVSDDVHHERTYSFLLRNSNSYIRALLEAANLPIRRPGGWTPGWENTLGY